MTKDASLIMTCTNALETGFWEVIALYATRNFDDALKLAVRLELNKSSVSFDSLSDLTDDESLIKTLLADYRFESTKDPMSKLAGALLNQLEAIETFSVEETQHKNLIVAVDTLAYTAGLSVCLGEVNKENVSCAHEIMQRLGGSIGL